MSDRAPILQDDAGDQDAGDVTEDAFLGGRLLILQPKTGYRAGLDAVLLAACVPARDSERVLDAGAGVGVAGLAVAQRVPQARLVLVERDPLLARLARANIGRNDLAARAHLIEADLSRPLAQEPDLLSLTESFDHVLANPPFHVEGRGTAAADPVKAGANAMPGGDLERWARFMASMARPGGMVSMIHRADALGAVLAAFAGRMGATCILPIHPRDGEPASRILVQAVKGSRAPLEIRPGLVLHGTGNGFRPEVEAVLRDGAPLPLRRSPA